MNGLSGKDVAAAVLCTVLWGFNFVVIAVGLRDFPPLFFAAIRFLFTALPAIFWVRPPHVGWPPVVLVGLLMGVIQFGALYLSIYFGLSAGLASIVVQAQFLFTAVFGALWLHERPTGRQASGLALTLGGMIVIGAASWSTNSIIGFMLCLLAAASWGAGNVITRAMRPPQPFSLLIYSSAVAPLPLLLLSVVFEGPGRGLHALATLSLLSVGAIFYVVFGASLLGFGIWYRLISRYPSILIAQFTVLVPVVGVISAWAVLGQAPTPLTMPGAGLAMLGLVLSVQDSSNQVTGPSRAIAEVSAIRAVAVPGRQRVRLHQHLWHH